MKIVESVDLFSVGTFPSSPEWKTAVEHVEDAVRCVDWPHGSGKFSIYPESGKKTGEGNGVVPIKWPCIRMLREFGWETEQLPTVEEGVLECGDLDGLYLTSQGPIAFEWETGNISSSHRALNKLLLAFKRCKLVGGFLVVPSDKLKPYLTDRIGNIGELRPYFDLWKNYHCDNGILRIVVAEHDEISYDVPRIPKGKDGPKSANKLKKKSAPKSLF